MGDGFRGRPCGRSRRTRKRRTGSRRRSFRAMIASGGADRVVRVWSAETRDTRRLYRNNSDFISALAFSPDGTMLATGSLDGTVKLLSMNSYRMQRMLGGHNARITSLAFSSSNDLVASASEDRRRADQEPKASALVLAADRPRLGRKNRSVFERRANAFDRWSGRRHQTVVVARSADCPTLLNFACTMLASTGFLR